MSDVGRTSKPTSLRSISAAVLPLGFRSTFLDGLTPHEIKAALTAAGQERISPRQILQNEGDRAIRLWLLVTGRVAVYRLADDGNKVFLRWGLPGDAFGLATVLGFPEPYIVTIEVVQEGSLLAWDLTSVLPNSCFAMPKSKPFSECSGSQLSRRRHQCARHICFPTCRTKARPRDGRERSPARSEGACGH